MKSAQDNKDIKLSDKQKEAIRLTLTKAQMNAFINIVDCVSSAFEENEILNKNVKTIDKMLIKNGYKRKFK